MYYPENSQNAVYNMNTPRFIGVAGTITSISDYENNGCVKLFQLAKDGGGTVDFMVDSGTYIVNNEPYSEGMRVTFYYDTNQPAVLMYPPQHRAVVGVSENAVGSGESVKVDYFNRNLISSDNTLRLNIGPDTMIYMQNGQYFNGSVRGRDLLAFYSITTMRTPAQPTPQKIVVLCY